MVHIIVHRMGGMADVLYRLITIWVFTRIAFCQESNVRLQNGLTPREGRVEVRINGTWGTLCDSSFGINDAHVVCRSLGFTGALGTTSLSEFGPSTLTIHPIDLRCNGKETTLSECPKSNLDHLPEGCGSYNEAGVRCSDCRDVNPRCEEWASQGACESYPGEILHVCQRSCDQCTLLSINDSAPLSPAEDTCVTGHCYLDSNSGIVCVPTPIAPTPSSVRCMNVSTERTRTTLSPFEVVGALGSRLDELAHTTPETDDDFEMGLKNLASLFLYAQLNNLELHPEHILSRQRQVTLLFLYEMNLLTIEDNAFSGFPRIITLILGVNKIREIRNTAFTGLQQLQYLNLRFNEISSIESGTFAHLSNLFFLELNDNSLSYLQPGVFSGLVNLRALALFNNEIRRIDKGVFDDLEELQFLYLQSNNISDIQVGAFSDLGNLRILNLASNSISHLKRGVFTGLRSLQYLFLTNNNIYVIEGHAFESLSELQYMFFLGTELGAVDPNALTGLTSLEKMSTSDNRLCCLLPENTTCARTSPTSPLDTCSRLYPNLALRIAGWVMGLLAIAGNGGVLFIRLRDINKVPNKVQNTMIISLAVADILMGLYMIFITSADLKFGNEFYLRAPQWRDSHVCRVAGFLGFLSSEASVLTLTLITVDRFISIMFPFRPELKIRHKGSMILVTAVWAFTVLLSFGLVIVTSYRPDVYGLSDVCLGLPLHVEAKDTGVLEIIGEFFFEYRVDYRIDESRSRPPWLFSIIIFIGFNLVSFTFILICYIMIFVKSTRASKNVRNSKSMNQETKLAVRMAMIVATDLVCWMPVIIMGILSQTGAVTLDPSLYAWTVILIVPINSSINPFLYTFIMYIEGMKAKTKSRMKDDKINLEVKNNHICETSLSNQK
ncbi:relaxin receptor 2-like isoform X3 [Lytechinus variegatus]|uniref:relaxin receptor 2-like isoform X3 n=1 Tax=Lytechinus variegatus TaxID=7654 RepID=UPI001BB22F17|nr:relaxin receptor 2-like isoform X3 [Lytechinus variegatus]